MYSLHESGSEIIFLEWISCKDKKDLQHYFYLCIHLYICKCMKPHRVSYNLLINRVGGWVCREGMGVGVLMIVYLFPPPL